MARKTPVRGYGCRICAARETAGFSQAYLAAELGLTRGAAAISNIETEKHEPRFSLVGRISDVLDVSLDSLWGKAEDSKEEAYVEHLIERLGTSNRVLNTLVTAIEEVAGPAALNIDRWNHVRKAILSSVPVTDPAMSQARFEMTRPDSD